MSLDETEGTWQLTDLTNPFTNIQIYFKAYNGNQWLGGEQHLVEINLI